MMSERYRKYPARHPLIVANGGPLICVNQGSEKHMTRYRIAAAVLAGTAIFAVSPAFAVDTGSDTGTIGVSLTVVEECTLITAPLAFGTAGIIDENVEATADITIECTKHSPYAIGLSAGLNAGGTDVTARKLKNSGTDTLNYQLYSDGGFGTVWGHTIGTNTVDGTDATGADETFTIHGRIPTHQNAPAGSYSDTITATIWYGEDLPED
jgi:spore coat protein U-like protein